MVREALKVCGLDVELEVARNGREAVARMASDAEVPDLVILDLNMPLMGGHAVLEARARMEKLAHTPFVVLTTSAAEQDVTRAYHLHADAVLAKPADFDAFVELIRSIHRLWLDTATTAPSSDADA